MPNDNNPNLSCFEAQSMRELYEQMETWQNEQGKRFLSVSVEKDGGTFCCIALSNPMEIIIMDGSDQGGVSVTWQELGYPPNDYRRYGLVDEG